MSQLFCPYTRKQLSEIDVVNREHILPIGLGAPESFYVYADAEKNRELGDLIDAPICNDPLMRFVAMAQGVVSRSGSVEAELGGATASKGDSVRATMSREGVGFRFDKPVDVDPVTKRVTGVKGFGEEAQKHAERIKRDYAKKGIQVEIGDADSESNPWLNFEIRGDMDLLRQELTKTAYLMTVRVFGDEAILSPSGATYRAAMLCSTVERMYATGILAGANVYAIPGLPKPAQNEHALTCFRLGNKLNTVVTFFGTFSGIFSTPTDGFSGKDADGMVVIIDARTQSVMRTMPFIEWAEEAVKNLTPEHVAMINKDEHGG